MERSVTRGELPFGSADPDCASLHPGYLLAPFAG